MLEHGNGTVAVRARFGDSALLVGYDVQAPGGTLQRIPNALLSGAATTSFQIGSLAGGGTLALGANSLTVGGANHNASFTGNASWL